jgi:hypothetical protein
MNFFCFRISVLLLTVAFVSNGCDTDDNDNNNPDNENVSIIGKWQMYGSTELAIEFTNYGIAIWTHKPYMNSNLNYTYSGTTLTVSDNNGTGIFSDKGNTLKINGFYDHSSFGTEGSTGPYINGTYVRQ